MFNAEFMRCICGHRNMFIAEPMRPKLSPRVQRWMWDIHNIIPPKHVHRWTYETKVVTSLGKNVQRWIRIHEIWTYGHRNMFIAEPRPMRPKLSPREAKMFNAECEMHMHMVTYRTCSLLNLCQLQRHFARQNIGNCAKSCLHRVQLGGLYNMVQ